MSAARDIVFSALVAALLVGGAYVFYTQGVRDGQRACLVAPMPPPPVSAPTVSLGGF